MGKILFCQKQKACAFPKEMFLEWNKNLAMTMLKVIRNSEPKAKNH